MTGREFSVRRSDFGDDFTFGAATAAYQIEGGQEGGRGPCIWDTFAATPGNTRNQESGRFACDHYHRLEEDLDLLGASGLDAYRFSIAWPRVLPQGRGAVNEPGLDFYERLVDGLLDRGIQPFATLYHWDLPSSLQDLGGWMNRDIADWFADYAALIARRLGDRLTTIATLNEPWCTAWLGHYTGKHAPGYRDLRAASRAMHHVMLAHGKAMGAMRGVGAKGLGIVTVLKAIVAASDAVEDQAAMRIEDALFNRWYMDALFKSRYPADLVAKIEAYLPSGFEQDLACIATPMDWLGINYYTRQICAHDPRSPLWQSRRVEGDLPKNDLGWEIYPEGLTQVLQRARDEYTRLPLFVTENGISETNDARRIEFYDQHLKAVLAAREAGVDVRGYFAWSFMDNYEWAEGYTPRFGLVHVDYETQRRSPKDSFWAFQRMLRS